MSESKISFVANPDFVNFISKFAIGKEKEAILKGDSKNNTIICIKKLSSMKVSGTYKLSDKRVAELSTKTDNQYTITDAYAGIIDSKKFSQIIKLNTDEFWFILKSLEDVGMEKILTVTEKKMYEIPLSNYVNEKEKAVDITRESIFKNNIPSPILNTISKDCSVIDGQHFYLGFKDENKSGIYKVYIIIGDKEWYKTEIDLEISINDDSINKLKEGCGNATYFKENSDGYNYIIRYNKDDLKEVLNVIDDTFDMIVFLNLRGGLIFNESKTFENNNLDISYGIIPIAQ